jgi:hypothetical protein
MALGYGLDDRGFESREGLGIFLFTTASGQPLGSTQLAIQWVPEAHSLGVKRTVREADHSSARSRMRRAIPPLTNTPSWHGAQLKHRDNFDHLLYLLNGGCISNGSPNDYRSKHPTVR